MDIDLLHNNHMYYDGFEGEEEVEITLINDQSLSIHFWIGYMDDILSNPDLQGKGWAGFTKALFQMTQPLTIAMIRMNIFMILSNIKMLISTKKKSILFFN